MRGAADGGGDSDGVAQAGAACVVYKCLSVQCIEIKFSYDKAK